MLLRGQVSLKFGTYVLKKEHFYDHDWTMDTITMAKTPITCYMFVNVICICHIYV